MIDPKTLKLGKPVPVENPDLFKLPNVKMEHRPDINEGRPFVIFQTLRYEGRARRPHTDNWLFNLESVAGTLDHIMKYENKPGWKIIAYGNLVLDKNRPGAQADAVEEQQRIHQHCARAVGVDMEMAMIQEAAARKVAEAEKRAKEADDRLAAAMNNIGAKAAAINDNKPGDSKNGKPERNS